MASRGQIGAVSSWVDISSARRPVNVRVRSGRGLEVTRRCRGSWNVACMEYCLACHFANWRS